MTFQYFLSSKCPAFKEQGHSIFKRQKKKGVCVLVLHRATSNAKHEKHSIIHKKEITGWGAMVGKAVLFWRRAVKPDHH